MWQQQDGVSSYAYANLLAGGTWGTGARISDAQGPVMDTHVKMDAAGQARAVWYQPAGTTGSSSTTVCSNTCSPGTGWGDSGIVATLTGIDGYFYYPVPRIGMNSDGDSFTVWGVDSM